jgi:inosine/xanthosine triphosphatase
MHIAVGSTNPVKLKATRAILSQLHPTATFTAIDVPSGVADQPWGDEETRRGATNRARAALSEANADLAVGLEGGVQDTEVGMFTCAWCAIVDQHGRLGIGGSSCTQLPPQVARQVRAGDELGTAMDALTGETGIKYKGGAIGVLTGGLQTRQSAYEVIISMALSPFLRPEWYGKAT